MFCSVAVAIFVATAAPAQEAAGSAVIEGRVLNPVTGDYLNNARVIVAGTNREVFTDSSGAYRLTGVPVGTVTLRVFYTEMDPQEATVQALAGETVTRDFNLTSRARYGDRSADEVIELDRFIVAATRETDAAAIATNEQRFAANMKNVVAADAFGDVAEGNVGEFVKFLPGVSIEYGAGDARAMTLRGLPPEFTPVTVDGVSMASAASSSASRVFEFEQVSINNAARVEVIKTPIPSMPANSIGGSLNLVSKRAFDRSRPLFSYRAFFTFTDEDMSLGKSPGPGTQETAKARPGADITYIAPVSKNFGFTVTAMHSDQFGRERFSIPTWEYLPASGGSEANPYFRGYSLRDDPRETKRQSIGLGADWKPLKPLTLSFNYQFNTYDLQTNVNRLTFNTGTLPPSFSSTATTGRLNAGTTTHTPLWVNKFGDTHFFSLKARYELGDWKADFTGGYSKATNEYADLESGFFRTANIRIVTPTVSYAGITAVRPGEITVRRGTTAVDWTQLANYQVVSAESLPIQSYDEITSGNLNLRRELTLAGMPAAIQVGGAYRKQVRDRIQERFIYTYIGPDGVATSADDGAAAIAEDVYVGQDPGHGWPSTIQWASMTRLAEVYRANPGYFRLNEVNNVLERASNSERIQETILAAYLQGELKMMNNRLSLIGGGRFERTEDKGVGLLRNRDATHPDPVQQARLQYIERGSSARVAYDDFYPSGNATFTITPELLLRFGISKTIGRPDFSNIIPNVDVDENSAAAPGQPGGSIIQRNPNLKPWTAMNYDVALEYYFKKSGVVSVGAFRKDISDAFGTFTYLLDQQLLAQFDLPAEYLGWELTTKFNTEGAQITGYEANYQQSLTMLPAWAKGISIFANGTVLDLDGTRADFSGFVEKSANWGASYSRGPVGLRVNWNYRGKQFINNQPFAPDAVAYVLPRLTMDASVEYRLSRRLSFFLNGRNLTKDNIDRVKVSGSSPEYARLYQRNIYSIKFTAGIRGSF